MEDLYLGLVILAGLALLVFCLVVLCTRRLTIAQRTFLAGVAVTAMLLYVRFVWQNIALANWLPVANLVILGNWFPIFLAALAGIVLPMTNLPVARRAIVVTLLAAAGCYAALLPLLGQAPQCEQRWSRWGDCVQTTDYTCTPASAATLLRAHGIAATEQEMAELCLTRKGTSWLGLYRGLKLKTQGTSWDVEMVRCSVDELVRFADRPMIAEVGLQDDDRADPTFRSEFGWAPGRKHSVVLSGFSATGRAKIIDPAPMIGREEWDTATLRVLWRGYGLRLIERPSSPTDLARN